MRKHCHHKGTSPYIIAKKSTLLVHYKHVLMGRIRALTRENVSYQLIYVQSCRNLYHIKFFFWLIFDDLSTPQEILIRISFKTRSMSKISFVVSLPVPHPHHPTYSLSVVGNSLARYLLLTSFSKLSISTQLSLVYSIDICAK